MNNGRYPNNSVGVADYINIIQNEERNERISEKIAMRKNFFSEISFILYMKTKVVCKNL